MSDEKAPEEELDEEVENVTLEVQDSTMGGSSTFDQDE